MWKGEWNGRKREWDSEFRARLAERVDFEWRLERTMGWGKKSSLWGDMGMMNGFGGLKGVKETR